MPNIINCLSFSLWLIATITCSTFAQAGDLYLIELLDEDSDDEDGFEPIKRCRKAY